MSLAPRRMIPRHSWLTPGRKPGTSTKVRIGMLNASQVRTNRAAFSEASMSRQPARCIGWLATTPTGAPSPPPKPTTMFGANPACTSRNSPSSSTWGVASGVSYGWVGESGVSVASSVCGSSGPGSFPGAGAAGARPNDRGDLRHDAGGHHVAVEDLGEQAERDHALLDAGAAAVVDPDDRAAGLQRVIHDLDDLLAVDLAERPAEHGEVLAEHADRAPVHGAVPGDDAVPVRPGGLDAEVVRPVPGQLVELGERARVEQHADPLPGGLLAPVVLLGHRLIRAGVHSLVPPSLQVGELARGGVRIGGGSAFGGFRTHGDQATGPLAQAEYALGVN